VHLRGLRGGGHHLLDLLDAAHDGGELDEAGLCGFGDDFGEGGFADARRTPEDHGPGVVALDLHAQRLAGTDEVLLSAEFIKSAGAHALGQGAVRGGPWGPSGSPSKRLMLVPIACAG
jgi:hypothetical protein